MTDGRVRWGVHATGHMAAKFVADLRWVPDAVVTAVVSREAATAQSFAERHGISYATTETADLAGRVDVAYIATPAPQHARVALDCLALGVPVLVEKPFATNAADALRIIEAGRAAGVFVMEAMWMRLLPGIRRVADLVAGGAIGVPHGVTAAFGRPGPFPTGHRLRRADLGGGALLDMGVYPISFAHLLFGMPDGVTASTVSGDGGVDDATTMVLTYADARAVLHCSIAGPTANTAVVTGSDGHVLLPPDFVAARSATVVPAQGEPHTITWPRDGWGYQFQALEVHRCLAEGATQSPLVSHETTLDVLRIVDSVRAAATRQS